MNTLEISGPIKKFAGNNGWYYLLFDDELSRSLYGLAKSQWPALRKAENLHQGDHITVRVRIDT